MSEVAEVRKTFFSRPQEGYFTPAPEPASLSARALAVLNAGLLLGVAIPLPFPLGVKIVLLVLSAALIGRAWSSKRMRIWRLLWLVAIGLASIPFVVCGFLALTEWEAEVNFLTIAVFSVSLIPIVFLWLIPVAGWLSEKERTASTPSAGVDLGADPY